METMKLMHISESPHVSGYYIVIKPYQGNFIYFWNNETKKWHWSDYMEDKCCLDEDEVSKHIGDDSWKNLVYLDIPLNYEDYKNKQSLEYMNHV